MKRVIVCILLALLLVGCAGSKKVSEKSTVTNSTELSSFTKDSVAVKEINKKIDDAVKILVTNSNTSDEAFDAAVNRAVDDILSKLNIEKQSGDNSYNLYYDKIKRELLLQMKVGETKSESTKVDTDSNTEKTFEQKTDEYLFKKINMIPWWVWAIAVFWLLPSVIERVKLIVNPISSIFKK